MPPFWNNNLGYTGQRRSRCPSAAGATRCYIFYYYLGGIMERALIVRQPWIELILSGRKTWEMRSSPTKIRGRVGLIEQGTGLIVGETTILDSLPALGELQLRCGGYRYHKILDHDILNKWKYPWVLHNTVRYQTPKPYSHKPGAVIWVKI